MIKKESCNFFVRVVDGYAVAKLAGDTERAEWDKDGYLITLKNGKLVDRIEIINSESGNVTVVYARQ